MTTKNDDNVVESRSVTVGRDKFDKEIITPKVIADATPVLDDKNNMILSQAIRDEQEAAGYAPDLQPKCVGGPVEMLTGVTGTAPGGVGAQQATGNIVVAAAASVSREAAIEAGSPVPGALGVKGGADLPKDKQLLGDNPDTAKTPADAKAAAKGAS